MLGHSVKVRTLEGEKEIYISPGTQNGQTIKLEGKVETIYYRGFRNCHPTTIKKETILFWLRL